MNSNPPYNIFRDPEFKSETDFLQKKKKINK